MKYHNIIFKSKALVLATLIHSPFGFSVLDTHTLPQEALGSKYKPRAAWSEISFNEDGYKTLMSLHHTVTGCGILPRHLTDDKTWITTNSDELIKQETEIANDIVKLHRSKGWPDIGYHFLIGPSGTVYEARPLAFQGTHTFKLNQGNIGIAFLGCYDSQGCVSTDEAVKQNYQLNQITENMIESAAELIANLSALYDIDIEKSFGLAPTEENRATIKVWARSDLDLASFKATNFPHSPGDKLRARMGDILEKAIREKKALEAKKHKS